MCMYIQSYMYLYVSMLAIECYYIGPPRKVTQEVHMRILHTYKSKMLTLKDVGMAVLKIRNKALACRAADNMHSLF